MTVTGQLSKIYVVPKVREGGQTMTVNEWVGERQRARSGRKASDSELAALGFFSFSRPN